MSGPPSTSLRDTARLSCAALLVTGLAAVPIPASAQVQTPAQLVAPRVPAHTGPADLDVLYVGAHPDDEAFGLSTLGEWKERYGARTGVVTVTRGEGGGNAVGPEEGPALGLIREREERAAVGKLGIRDVYNLDKVDFYYSVSAPLHQRAWGERDTLRRLVRVIRSTTPDVLMTMNPAPSPGNHGGHQEAARLAVQAYYAAGNPRMFPAQVRAGLEPYAPKRLFSNDVRGESTADGPGCPTAFTPTEPADDVYGVWSGRRAENGRTWAEIEREAQREYASQGWAGFPDVSADPAQLPCHYFTQIDSRVPFTRGDLTADAAASSSMLEGALLRAPGGLPVRTGLDLSAARPDVAPGASTTLRLRLSAPHRRPLRRVRIAVDLPAGWTGPSRVQVGFVRRGTTVTKRLQVTAPVSADAGRSLVGVTVRSTSGTGFTDTQLDVVPVVEGTQQLLPQVAEFERWADDVGVQQLEGTVTPVLTLPSGGTRTVSVDVVNHGTEPAAGDVTLDLPAGFTADGPAAYAGLAPGESTTVDVEVTNDDDTLPTSNQGGDGGDYDYTVSTTSGAGTSTSAAALELVPTTTLPDAAAPTLDGTIGAGEYSSEIDLSRLWEGDACESPADCSATGWMTRSGDDLYIAADVTDDTLGTVLAASDCKRHWRVDSLELAIDPTGTSENTSTTFKAGILPTTTDGVACAARDADNRQGPIGTFTQVGGTGTPELATDDTAPGFDVVSRLKEPYTGYVIEAKIPMSVLPATVDPEHLAVNAFVYDSDTQDKTGQTRLGWSTWGGVQGDPYRWGRVVLDGAAPPQVQTSEPLLDFPALSSVESPQSIAQAVRTGVALSGAPRTPRRLSATVVRAVPLSDAVRAVVRARSRGTAHLFAMYGGEVVGQRVVHLRRGTHRIRIATPDESAWRVLMGFESDIRGTASSAAVVPVR